MEENLPTDKLQAAARWLTRHAATLWGRQPMDAPAEPFPALPAGTVTFLFTDIESSTVFWDRFGADFQQLKHRHDAIVRQLAALWQGQEITSTGDGFFLVFPAASRAIRFAVALQTALGQTPLALPRSPTLLVRVGIHTGEAMDGDGGSFDGPNTNLAARLCAAGHGGQILASRDACRSAQANVPEEIEFRELGGYHLKGFAREVAVSQINAPGLPAEFPPLNAVASVRAHLPAYGTPFVGRRDDLEQLREWLRDDRRRLIVLVGLGGVGKTRLAVEAAETADDPDGVWFVDAQTVQTAPALFRCLVLTLDLTPLPQENPEECALRLLPSRSLLLLLDNLEQVEDAAAALARLLQAAPRLRLLVTTRERLPLAEARVFEVGPFLLPEETVNTETEPGAVTEADLAAALAVESVQFFAERAASRRRDFEVNRENVGDVAGLCRALDGIPLALELAAGWISVLEPGDMLAELQARNALLGAEYADLPARQRTVRASLDWSYGRLRPEDQTLLARLGVFAGGFDRDALAAVCGNALDGLRRLLEHSLLTRRAEDAGTRYGLLNTTRAYAAEKLAALAEADEVRARHAEHYARRAAEGVAQWRTAGESAAFAKLTQERDNLQAALAWAGAASDSLAASLRLSLAASLRLSLGAWQERCGFLREARAHIHLGWEAAQAANLAATPLGAALLRERVGLHLDLLELAEAHAWGKQFLDLCRALNLPAEIGYAHNLLGAADKDEHRYAAARAEFTEALSCFTESGILSGQAIARNNLGLCEFQDPDGDLAGAERWWAEAGALFRQAGDRRGLAEVATNRGNAAEARQDWDTAVSRYGEALELELALEHTFGTARALSNLGEIALARQSWAEAYRLNAAAQALLERAGSPFAQSRRPLLVQAAAALALPAPDPDALVQSLKRKPLDALVGWATEEAA